MSGIEYKAVKGEIGEKMGEGGGRGGSIGRDNERKDGAKNNIPNCKWL